MEFLCAAQFSKSWPYFRPKNFIFVRPALQLIMPSLLILQHKQKIFLKPFQIPIFLFLFYLFGIEPINTFIHSRKFLQNHTRFQTKMGLYPFSDPWRGTYLYGLYKRVPSGFYFLKLSPLESWLEAEHPLHTLQTPLMDTFLDTNSTILLF